MFLEADAEIFLWGNPYEILAFWRVYIPSGICLEFQNGVASFEGSYAAICDSICVCNCGGKLSWRSKYDQHNIELDGAG